MPHFTQLTFDIWEVILIGVVIVFVVYGLTNYIKTKEVVELPKDKTIKRPENMCEGTITIKKLINAKEAKIYYALTKTFKESYNINPQVSFKVFLVGEQDIHT
ncbi:DUF2726 domain-containing protein [Helicobacter mastomyrinus]|uniref:DUF2726 domain-containing protein n=1 Tax=Helicobacter mastomyrinus TaxID=287948 RepID=A0ABZ3F582_9HELI|nr:DUF2726 domain-containing protein [uncultured Helicobacter sp.]